MAIKILDNITAPQISCSRPIKGVETGFYSGMGNPGLSTKFNLTDLPNRTTYSLTFENGLLVDFRPAEER
jgi:hypothetical protein